MTQEAAELGALRKFLQDIIAPELGANKASLAALQREIAIRADASREHLEQSLKAVMQHTDDRIALASQQVNSRVDALGLRMDTLETTLALRMDTLETTFSAKVDAATANTGAQIAELTKAVQELRAKDDGSLLRILSNLVISLTDRVTVIENRTN